MVSLRKFLSKEEQQAAASQDQERIATVPEGRAEFVNISDQVPGYFALPLLQGISRTAVESDPEELTNFQRTIDAIVLALEQERRPEAAHATVLQSVKVLEAYNERVQLSSKVHHNELRNMISLMVEAMVFLTTSNKTSVEQLS